MAAFARAICLVIVACVPVYAVMVAVCQLLNKDYYKSTKVYSAFLDASKAFDKVLHNGLFVKMLRRNVPVCLVRLLRSWYGQLQC